jgi:hypothetical protein
MVVTVTNQCSFAVGRDVCMAMVAWGSFQEELTWSQLGSDDCFREVPFWCIAIQMFISF